MTPRSRSSATPTSRELRTAPGLLKVMRTQRDAEFLEDEHGEVLGERFDQVKLRAFDERQHALRHPLVVQGVVDRIGQRGLADIGADLDVDENGLPDLPLPIEDADDRLGLERVYEYLIH